MNLLASSIKSASYDELYGLGEFLVETFALNEDEDAYCIEASQMAHRISQWADYTLGQEVKKR
jgi:hypothetical protein